MARSARSKSNQRTYASPQVRSTKGLARNLAGVRALARATRLDRRARGRSQ
jgi:hypothetical protein